MRGFSTSYWEMFEGDKPINRVEIPLIQRDYAQGRTDDPAIERIRHRFLDDLRTALEDEGPRIDLDFVFGSLRDGVLLPLDGQQRLTTLFLLHWYLACRSGNLDSDHGWKRLTYALRPSAEPFCEQLVKAHPPQDEKHLSAWIEDQYWYRYGWRHDPTVGSMLVMIDDIHKRFGTLDCFVAWKRLTNRVEPAISFHLLPVEELGPAEDLYIRMNSRGKELTAFENFKAELIATLQKVDAEKATQFAQAADGEWADMFWHYHGDDMAIDDEFLRYFQFITEAAMWRTEGNAEEEAEGASQPTTLNVDLTDLAKSAYGGTEPEHRDRLDFMFLGLNTWESAAKQKGKGFGQRVCSEFFRLPSDDSEYQTKAVLFSRQDEHGLDLFRSCCRTYGERRGRNRIFTLQHTILLYAVVFLRVESIGSPGGAIRILRNLVEASSNEIRLERMSELVADTQTILRTTSVDDVTAFNQAQCDEERAKAEFLQNHPTHRECLLRLEDHRILRGCLAAFEFDPERFSDRARAFLEVFATEANLPAVTGALLAFGDYSRRPNDRYFQLGSAKNDAPWREVLTSTPSAKAGNLRAILGRFLDAIANRQGSICDCLDEIQNGWLATAKQAGDLDWRYYFVKYPVMRDGASGMYFSQSGPGYSVCMLDARQINSNYRDPFLSAILALSQVGDAVKKPIFYGYEAGRWLTLVKSGVEMRCEPEGIRLQRPSTASFDDAYSTVCTKHTIDGSGLLCVSQNAAQVDTVDRGELAAGVLRDLVAAGL